MILRIETLTPVHIGTGTKIPKFAAIPEGKTIKILDIDKLAEEFKDNIDALTYAIELGKPLSGDIREKAAKTAKYALLSYVSDFDNCREVLECLKDTHHEAYLPGSSIKGAIRTAILFAHKGSKHGKELFEISGAKLDRPREFQESYGGYGKDRISEKIFDELGESFEGLLTEKNEDEKMRRLKIGDSTSTKKIGLYKSLVLSLKQNNGLVPKSYPIYLETIDADEKFELMLNTEKFFLAKELSGVCTLFAQKMVTYDEKFFSKYGEAETAKLYETLMKKFTNLPHNQFPLRVGWGCGNIGTSLNLGLPDGIRKQVAREFRKHPDEVPFPKTRRLTERGHVPFGWLLCTLEE